MKTAHVENGKVKVTVSQELSQFVEETIDVTEQVAQHAEMLAEQRLKSRIAPVKDAEARAVVKVLRAANEKDGHQRKGAIIQALIRLAEELGAGDVLRREVMKTLGAP